MVSGIESFARKFRDYSDCYTVIGGTACAVLMSETDPAKTESQAKRSRLREPPGAAALRFGAPGEKTIT